MFPVPSHLPRTGGEHSSSRQNSGSGSPNAGAAEDEMEVDLVLDLFEPILKEKELKSETVRGVRERLEIAARENKNITHELLKENYPSISSHIRAGSEIKANFGSIETRLAELEAQIDPNNAETSFIPPVLALLQRHFTAVRLQSRSKAHITALQDLKGQVERLDRLETAVYEARGADDEVLDELEDDGNSDLAGALAQSSVFKTIQGRRELLRSMVVEQVTDGFKQAVKLQDSGDSPCTTAEKTMRLQKPRNQRPGFKALSSAKDQPAYILPQLYSALSRLRALEGPLRQLQVQIVEQLITPLLRGQSTIKLDSNDTTATLHLISATARTPTEILADLSSIFDYMKSSAFPESPTVQSERDLFFADLHGSTTRLLLSELVLPSLPPTRADLPTWLATVQAAVGFESESKSTGSSSSNDTLLAFYDNQAGSSWANLRRRRVADQVRKLILDGWEGWEAVEISRDKEISVVVEVEVEDEDEPMPMPLPTPPTQESNAETTVSKDAGSSTNSASTSTTPSSPEVTEEEAGWGFDEDAQQESQAQAGPSSPKRNGGQSDDVDDGWAFDDDLSTAAPVPAPVIAPKPTREAKKLGKRVAKAKAPSSGDDHEDDAIAIQGHGQGGSIHNTRSSSRTTSDASSMPPPAIPVPARVTPNESMDWEAWDDEKTSPKTSVKPKAKRKVLKEEKRTIEETFLVSKACETLLGLAEEVLRDAQEIQADLPAPSFSLASTVLHNTATEVFDLYRALLTSHYATQLQSVPTLSMQVYNDSIHLSDRIRSYEKWSSTTVTDTQRRLRESGEACFERELDRQRVSLISTLDDLEWGRGVEGLKRSQGVPKQVRGDLEDLSRMFQTVLPTTTFLSVMGYLVNVSIAYITDAILSQQDITEDESIQLTELLRTLHPLEELFILEPGQPSSVVEHVHGWLKFCYLQELLSANLVDITYLFENGALVDFTPDELISLLKALFADSEKREKAIERIERGL